MLEALTILITLLIVIALALMITHRLRCAGKAKHKAVYQLNNTDDDCIDNILFSANELLRMYGDDIHIVIITTGPGIYLMSKAPSKLIRPVQQQRACSLIEYGMEFQVCGNTMESLGWQKNDLFEHVVVVPFGAASLMLLQQQGYSYISC